MTFPEIKHTLKIPAPDSIPLPRTKSYADAAPLLENIMNETGAVELRELTDIDRLGIPVFTAARPQAAWGGTRVHTAAGLTPEEAVTKAVIGAVERFSAEYRREEMEFTSYEKLGLLNAADPSELILPRELEFGEEMHWSKAYDFLEKREIFVPSNAVFHPYDPLGRAQQLFRSDSNGLAAGFSIEEAVLHGICEVIERDAMSRAEKKRTQMKKLVVDDSAPKALKDLMLRYSAAGIEIYLRLIESKGGIYTAAAASDDTVSRDPSMLIIGSASSLSPVRAVTDALIEIAKRRAVRLNREYDLKNADQKMLLERVGYERFRRLNAMWFNEPSESVSLSDLEDRSTETVDGDLDYVIGKLADDADYVFAVDMTKTSVPAVRVIIPGFEVSYVDPSRMKKY